MATKPRLERKSLGSARSIIRGLSRKGARSASYNLTERVGRALSGASKKTGVMKG